MAKVHVLSSENPNRHSAVVHFLPPTGNNAMAVTWKSVLLAAGEIGKVAQASTDATEAASILAGDIVEVPFTIMLNPTIVTGAARTAGIDQEAEMARVKWVNSMQIRYNYRGYTQGTVS